MSEVDRAPGPRGHWLFGSLRAFRKDPIGLLMDARKDYGDVVRLRLGPTMAHLISHPQGIRHVLQTRHMIYTKNTRGVAKLREVLGNGLLTSDGDFWLKQRRTAQPAFHRERIAVFGSLMAAAVSDMLATWERATTRGILHVDVAKDLMTLTLRIVGLTLLGSDVEAEAQRVSDALGVILHVTNDRVKAGFDVPSIVPTRANLRFRRAMRVLDEIVVGMIAARRRRGPGDDLLSMLMEARDPETGQGMTDRQLRDEAMTVFLAGHETTANALTWTLYLLSQHPDVAARLHAEVVAVQGDAAKLPVAGSDLPYATMVLQESMRLYPPAWLFGRSPSEDDEIDGKLIEAGSLVFLSPYVTQRHPGLWPEPDRFLPDRFAPERAAAIEPFAHFPFGGGPRLCIGRPFAMLEMQIVLASVVRRFWIRLAPEARIEPEALVTLRPRHGMPMILEAR